MTLREDLEKNGIRSADGVHLIDLYKRRPTYGGNISMKDILHDIHELTSNKLELASTALKNSLDGFNADDMKSYEYYMAQYHAIHQVRDIIMKRRMEFLEKNTLGGEKF